MTQANPASKPDSVLDFIKGKAEKFAERPALSIKEDGSWVDMTFGELTKRATKFSGYLVELGVKPGDRIALLSEAKPDWGVAFFGVIRAGAVVVPLDVKLTESELTNIMSDCQPTVVLADTKHLEVTEAVAKSVKSIKNIYCVDSKASSGKYQTIDSLLPKGNPERRERQMEETALIVYTSGTTGNPKGVMTTFGNLIFQVCSFKDVIALTENDRFLSVLPLNHLYELAGGFLGALNEGGSVCFCHSLFPAELLKAMNEKKITAMVAVPLLLKTLKGSIEREIRKAGEEANAKFQAALQKADELPMEARRQMFAAIHQQLGGHLRVVISGGAPLDPDVGLFFNRIGLNILQGYGLTETSPVISGNSVSHNKLGSVGQALPGVEIKIDLKGSNDHEGEILTRGPHVMRGYYGRDEQTREVIDEEGWFHTGDIGFVDDDGYLHITGRIKNLIVLGGGKKVFPEEVEMALSEGSTIKELCVLPRKQSDGFKEGTEEVCAVVVPADSLIAANKGQPEQVQKLIKDEFETLGKNLATYKRPTKIFIYEGDLPKTATRKVKRPLVAEWLKAQK